jgi:hypothetical protein
MAPGLQKFQNPVLRNKSLFNAHYARKIPHSDQYLQTYLKGNQPCLKRHVGLHENDRYYKTYIKIEFSQHFGNAPKPLSSRKPKTGVQFHRQTNLLNNRAMS